MAKKKSSAILKTDIVEERELPLITIGKFANSLADILNKLLGSTNLDNSLNIILGFISRALGISVQSFYMLAGKNIFLIDYKKKTKLFPDEDPEIKKIVKNFQFRKNLQTKIKKEPEGKVRYTIYYIALRTKKQLIGVIKTYSLNQSSLNQINGFTELLSTIVKNEILRFEQPTGLLAEKDSKPVGVNNFEVHHYPEFDKNGNLTSVLSITQNITEIKNTQEQIALLSFAFNSVSEAAFLIDESARFRFVNNESCRILGYSTEELLNLKVSNIDPGFPAKRWKKHWEELKAKKSLMFEGHHRKKDGSLFPVEISANYFKYGDKEFNLALVRDITERKLIEEKINDSEERLRLTLETTQIGIWDWDVKNDQWFATPVYYTMLGYEPKFGNADRREWLERLHPDDREYVYEKIQDVLTRDFKEYEYEARLKHADGNYRWQYVRGISINRDEDGKVTRMLGIRMDINTRKLTEEALHVSEERYRRLTENARDVIYRMTLPGGKYEYVSPASISIFGYSPEEFYQNPNLIKNIIHPDWQKYFNEQRQNLINGQMPPTYEYQIIHKSGEVRWLNQRNILIKDEFGKAIAIEGIVTDITISKNAEAALFASEEKYRTLIKKIQAAVVVHGPDSRIVICNPLAEQLLGLKEDQLLGKTGNDPYWQFVREDNSTMEVDEYPVNQVLTTKKSIRDLVVGIHRRENEDNIWVLVNADPVFSNDNELVQVIVTFINITDRKRAEEELSESEYRYRKAQAIGHVGSWEYNIQTTNFWGSDEAKKIYGFDVNSEFFTTDEVENCIPERERVHQALIDLIENDTEYNLEFDIITHDNKERKTIISLADIEKDGKGNPIKITGVIADITDRKRAEEALRVSEQRYHTVFENSPLPIWEEDFSEVKKFFDKLGNEGIKDIEAYLIQHPEAVYQCAEMTKVIGVNKAALTMHSASSKDELLSGLKNTFTEESFASFQKQLIGLWNGQTEMVTDAVIKTIYGMPKDVTIYFSVCPGHETTLSKIIVSVIDITERKRNDAINASRFHLIQFAASHNTDQLLEETLNEVEKLTGSSIGFFHFVEDDQISLTLQNWSTKTKLEFCKAEGKGRHYNIDEAGVWVDCVYQRKPVLHNDYNSLPHRKGMPEGHAEVKREIVVPIIRGDFIKAILGVGNKNSDYNEKDVAIVSLLADLSWEIVERKMADEDVYRLNRELRAISDCNQTLLRADDEQTLLSEICKIICDEAGYKLAWVGYCQNDEVKSIIPVAWAGYDSDYIANAKLSWAAESETGNGPAGIAVRSGQICYIKDIALDERMAVWHEDSRKRGYQSGVAMPLKDENKNVFGVLLIYSSEIDAVNSSELRLLDELANDLAYGITALRIQENRRIAETALRESEERFRTIFENSPLGIFRSTFEGKYLEVNTAFAKIFGYDSPQSVLLEVSNIAEQIYIDKKDREEILNKQLISTDISQHCIKYRKKDGSEFMANLYIKTVLDAYGKSLYLEGIIEDITDRKNNENRILESERRFKELANLLPQTIFEADINEKIIFANEAALTSFGYDVQDIENGIYMRNMVSEKDRREALENILRILQGLPTTKNEYEMVRKDGSTFPALTFTTPILRDGERVGFRGTIVDISQRKRTENELRKLSEAVSQSPASIVITDLNGNIEYVNKTFEVNTGYTLQEVYNNNPRILKSGFMSKSEYENLWNTILAGNTWQGELLNKKKNGELYWEYAFISPVKDTNGVTINYLAVKQDITEKKKMIQELIDAKELAEKANNLKSEFLAQMSHEIRSPLNVMINMTSLIKDDFVAQLSEEQSEYFSGIESSGKRIVRTVDLILNASEVQIGSYQPIFIKIDLMKDILNEMKIEFAPKAIAKGLNFSIECKISSAIIMGDTYSIHQVFINLIDNAVKFTDRGSIKITVDKNAGNQVYVSVEDTGIGISEKYMATIFEPFTQEEHGYSRSFEGNGLGLNVVKGFCKLNNAEILIDSEKGKGSRFTVIFPKTED